MPAKNPKSLSLRLKDRPYQVSVAGSFNDWSCFSHPMYLSSSGSWETKLQLAPGLHRYRFLIDNRVWLLDPLADTLLNQYGGTDSVLIVERPKNRLVSENRLVEQFA